MADPVLYQTFADYNQQMNAQIYEVCATFPMINASLIVVPFSNPFTALLIIFCWVTGFG